LELFVINYPGCYDICAGQLQVDKQPDLMLPSNQLGNTTVAMAFSQNFLKFG
jgi:hypothetical protein